MHSHISRTGALEQHRIERRQTRTKSTLRRTELAVPVEVEFCERRGRYGNLPGGDHQVAVGIECARDLIDFEIERYERMQRIFALWRQVDDTRIRAFLKR